MEQIKFQSHRNKLENQFKVIVFARTFPNLYFLQVKVVLKPRNSLIALLWPLSIFLMLFPRKFTNSNWVKSCFPALTKSSAGSQSKVQFFYKIDSLLTQIVSSELGWDNNHCFVNFWQIWANYQEEKFNQNGPWWKNCCFEWK